jgi:hypothetical protein
MLSPTPTDRRPFLQGRRPMATVPERPDPEVRERPRAGASRSTTSCASPASTRTACNPRLSRVSFLAGP